MTGNGKAMPGQVAVPAPLCVRLRRGQDLLHWHWLNGWIAVGIVTVVAGASTLLVPGLAVCGLLAVIAGAGLTFRSVQVYQYRFTWGAGSIAG